MSDNRDLWNTVKTFLLDKTKKQGKITLVEKDEIASNDKKPCNFFNAFFANAVPNVNLLEFIDNFDHSGTDISACSIVYAIAKYENHPSVAKIGNKQAFSVTFSSKIVMEKEIEKIL